MTAVDFQLNWEPNGFQAPYFLARDRGFYEEEGLTVRFVEGHGSPFAAEEVACGRTTFGIGGASAVLTVTSQGHTPLAVATATKITPAAIYTIREQFGEPFENPRQLVGKTVAPSATKTRILTAQLLENIGIREQVELRSVDPHTHHRVQHQLRAGTVDAAVGVVTNGVELEREYGKTVDELPIGDALGVYGMMLLTSPAYAAENPETVQSFIRATARGWEAATNDPDAAIDALIARNATLERNREIERLKLTTATETLQFTDHVREAGWGVHEATRWERLASILDKTELLDGPVDSKAVWTNEYVDTDSPVIREYADRIGR